MKITLQNYEEWMIDYIEGNLSPEQQKELQEFLVFHPELQKELEAFGMTKLEPDMTVVFADKASLKREEKAGRVITMYSWIRYTAAVAAVLTVFIGFRYFGGAKEPNAIQQYSYETLDTPSIELPTTKKNSTVNTDINQTKKVKHVGRPVQQIAAINENKQQPKKREINPIQQIELEQSNSLAFVEDGSIKDALDMELAFAQEATPKSTVIANKTDISLNDNKTVVDWYQDAMAIGEEVSGVTKGVLDAELNPFKRKTAEEDVVRTRNVQLPGFSYYSRKSNN